MTTGKMKGVIVMLQEERLVVGEGVLLTEQSPDLVSESGLAMGKLLSFQCAECLDERLVDDEILFAIPAWRFIPVLTHPCL